MESLFIQLSEDVNISILKNLPLWPVLWSGSHIMFSNTRAPQEYVLSPLLFVLYTNEMQMQSTNDKLYKYADDMALVAHSCGRIVLIMSMKSMFWNLEKWCKASFLLINAGKTK